ncbi:MAG: FAD binding domain-containing protein [Sumerlaeia bacterium]
MKTFDYAKAENLSGYDAAAKMGYAPKAGGVDLLDLLKLRIPGTPNKLVDVRALDGMKAIRREDDGALWIGAAATLKQIGDSALLKENLPALAHAAGEAATPQVRAAATAAGNVLQRPRDWYWRNPEFHDLPEGAQMPLGELVAKGDDRYAAIFGNTSNRTVCGSNIAPVLAAARAKAIVHTPGADEPRAVPMSEFFALPEEHGAPITTLKPGELVLAFRIPKAPKASGFVEVRHKKSYDWALAMAAAVQHADGTWEVSLGAVAPVPWNASGAAKVLSEASTIDRTVAMEAAEASVAGANPSDKNRYRVHLTKVAVRDAILTAAGLEIA